MDPIVEHQRSPVVVLEAYIHVILQTDVLDPPGDAGTAVRDPRR
jgi:hypothetical protein